MGDIKRKRKLFSKPRKKFDLNRMTSENEIVKKYGLKNKKEIWKAKSAVSRFRKRAKGLIGKDMSFQQKFFEKLSKQGLKVITIADALGLTEEDLLERRLQTFVFKKRLSNSPVQARQLIVHKRVLVDGNVVNIPSFLVVREMENKITLKPLKVKIKSEKVENGEE